MFQKLRALNILSPIERKMSNPPLRTLDYSQHCAYCSDSTGHNIEVCWYLKRAIKDLNYTNRIMVESLNGPNINQNQLPRHTETNILEMMKSCEEFKVPYKPILKEGTSAENSTNVVDLTKMEPLGAKEASEKLRSSNKLILTVKGTLEDVRESKKEERFVVPRGLNKPILIVKGSYVTPVIISPVSQLPIEEPNAFPWNYDTSVVTYKGRRSMKK